MPRTVVQGRASHKARSVATLWWTAISVLARRAVRRPLVKEWGIEYEIATLFYRRQFDRALAVDDIVEGRAYFDSLYTVVEQDPDVDVLSSEPGQPSGTWFRPRTATSPITMLYFHGGGYAFDAAVSRHFIAQLASWTGMPIFAPAYRLTPEHPHPAQLDDGVAAYRWLLEQGTDPSAIVVSGDSAGGHLVLMLLSVLNEQSLPQPAIGIALSPWTDIGERGDSQFGHDRYDMVQGYQTIRYGRWLRGDTSFTEAELSPIARDFRGSAPIYLQAGGKEILVDMIRDFAHLLVEQGVPVRLDVWAHMVHEFHAYGHTLPESSEAIECIGRAIAWATAGSRPVAFRSGAYTEIDRLPRSVPPSPSTDERQLGGSAS